MVMPAKVSSFEATRHLYLSIGVDPFLGRLPSIFQTLDLQEIMQQIALLRGRSTIKSGAWLEHLTKVD